MNITIAKIARIPTGMKKNRISAKSFKLVTVKSSLVGQVLISSDVRLIP